jgi:ADP-ribose pyrophosphatase YjhB (NUDIX family)
MKFCSQCGSHVEHKIPDDDNRLRYVCVSCDIIHYQNPNIVAGTIPVFGDKVLLCKRAIEPRHGFWTLPAGFMENQETTTEAAIRETLEEAEATVTIDGLFSVLNVPQIDQVHMFFLATMKNEQYGAGQESLETLLFSEDDIPWDELAFPTVKKTLKLYFEDRKRGRFVQKKPEDTPTNYDVHVADIIREPRDVPPYLA